MWLTQPQLVRRRGYGISFSSYGNHRLLSSSTSWAGVAARMWIVPERRFAMIILVNGSRNEGSALRRQQKGIADVSAATGTTGDKANQFFVDD
ncbi:MAG: hypothetical protein IPL01_13580 [Acidobacteria bacterium]|nr:hypothetical protein [Acidobacteriota bacterium]